MLVPTLYVQVVLYESEVINEYLEEVLPDPPMLPQQHMLRAKVSSTKAATPDQIEPTRPEDLQSECNSRHKLASRCIKSWRSEYSQLGLLVVISKTHQLAWSLSL